MRLTSQEKAMLDGDQGTAIQKAMDLLVRYAEALGAERFVDVTNIAGVPGSSTVFLADYFRDRGGGSYEDVFSHFDLDSDESLAIPSVRGNCCHLQGGLDPRYWEQQGKAVEALSHQRQDETQVERLGIRLLKTCTPYLAGNVPARGEHCAWMESSAVVFCNSVVGGRTNTEGRESTSAAMLTGKIPDWGLHQRDCRHGTHLIEVDMPVENVMDWGMLGYFTGRAVQDGIPVLTGSLLGSDPLRHKHLGAAAASSGGIEMYHIVGITPEASSLSEAFGPRHPVEIIRYGRSERRRVYEQLNSTGKNSSVDYVMLGCPHASLEQLKQAADLLADKKLHSSVSLWVFTSRAVRSEGELSGYVKTIEDAGGLVMTDTCSAIGRILPRGTRVVALDSAKQAHYLPAMMGVEAWFGTTEDCIQAALTGHWAGDLK